MKPDVLASVSFLRRQPENSRFAYQDDQLHEALATHQRPNGEAFSPQHAVQSCGPSGADEFREEGNGDHSNNISPGYATIQKADIGIETRECEIKGEEEGPNQVLNFLGDLDRKAALVRTNHTRHEGAENRVHANYASEESRGKSHEERKGNDALAWTVLKRTRSSQDIDEDGANGVNEKERIA